MFNQERQTEIMMLLEKNQRVSVPELSDRFGVSVDTVRRDLRLMEQQGLLKRTHGGALLPKKPGVSTGYSIRKRLHPKEKNSIAKLAASLIAEEDSLLLDGSTTAAAMVPELGRFQRLTVFTNSLSIASDIAGNHPQIKVFMIGGIIHPEHLTAISADCLAYVKKLQVDKVFVGSCSISPERGLSATEVEDAAIKKAMLAAGRQVIILADSSKFLHESLVQIAPLAPTQTVITDTGFDKVLQERFRPHLELGMRILIAE